MRNPTVRMIIALATATLAYGVVFVVAVVPEFGEPAPVETVSVEVRDPADDPWVQEEKARLEEQARALAEEAARLAQEKRDLEEKLKSVERMASAMAPQEADLAAREEKIQRLEEALDRTKAEADRKADLLLKQEAELEAERARSERDRLEFEKRQNDLEALAETLVEEQQKLAERSAALEKKESTVEAREAEMKNLAKILLDRQKQIQDKQAELEDSQKSLDESQTERDREWERIRDEWKKIEDQRKTLESKLDSASTTAAEWAALKAEWNKLEDQRKRLEEAQEVQKDVDRFKQGFDRAAYESQLARLRGSLSRQKVESEFIPFDFYFPTSDLRSSHLDYFGMMDVFYNETTQRFALKKGYGDGAFDRTGTWTKETSQEIYDVFSRVGLARNNDFYDPFVARAMDVIQGPRDKVRVFGLMPVGMVYEIVLHQKRVMEVLQLNRETVKRFQMAPWLDRSGGKWRFKIIGVTLSDGRGMTVRKVENYQF